MRSEALEDELEVDVVVAESRPHAGWARLVADVALDAVPPDHVVVERLGFRWPDGTTSSPDVAILPADAVAPDALSYVVTQLPPSAVAVEVEMTNVTNIIAAIKRGLPTYVVQPGSSDVVRVAPTGHVTFVANGMPCADLWGIAFQTIDGHLCVIDPQGRAWRSAEERRSMLAAERAALAAELAALAAERDALVRRVAELEGP